MASIADFLRPIGVKNSKGGQDTIAAFINPKEAALLKAMGGSGRTDPQTGMLHFDDDNGDGGYSSDNDDSSSQTDSANSNEGLGSGGSSFEGPGEGFTNQETLSAWDADAAAGVAQNEADAAAGLNANSFDLGAALGYGPSRSAYNSEEAYNNAEVAWANPGNINGFNPDANDPSLGGDAGRAGQAATANAAQGNFLSDFGAWQSQNPGISTALGIGLGLINPYAGLAYNIAGNYGRGNNVGLASNIGGLIGGPVVGQTINTIGNLAHGNFTGALSGLAGYGLNSNGLGLGQAGYNVGGREGAALGSSVQNAGLGSLGSQASAGINSYFSGLDGSSNPGEAAGGSDAAGGNGSYAGDYGATSLLSALPTGAASSTPAPSALSSFLGGATHSPSRRSASTPYQALPTNLTYTPNVTPLAYYEAPSGSSYGRLSDMLRG